MPALAQWYQRIPAALNALQQIDTPDFDRSAIEALLKVSRRDAVRILHRFGATRVGNSLKIARTDLIVCLEALQRGDSIRLERQRRRSVAQEVIQAELDATARSIVIQEPPPVPRPALDALPDTIELRAGLLSVRHAGPEDLLRQLLLLARTICHDHSAFMSRTTPS